MTNLYLVTGGAGFIGSHITERLLVSGAKVRVFDNFSTGNHHRLQFAQLFAGALEVIEGDIRNFPSIAEAAVGASVIFHQAATASVPLSVTDPISANDNNISGTLNVFEAARRAGVKRVVYASSSAVYGNRGIPNRETAVPNPMSPYAVSKLANEMYASVWASLYDVTTVGLRYFNVFGPRQNPQAAYAAVIPRFITAALRHEPLEVHGDGRQSRDFTYIDDVVNANVLAAQARGRFAQVLNVGRGVSVSLLAVVRAIEKVLGRRLRRRHTASRPGDVRHSCADISKARALIGYVPRVDLLEGIRRTIDYFSRT